MVTLFFYVIVPLRPGPQLLPDGALPRRPCQEHFRISAPASNIFQMAFRHGALASSIFPIALCHSAAILFAMALQAIRSASARRPATNLIRRRRVLRFG